MQVMQEIGMDLSQQTSKGVETYLGKAHFHYLITLCDDAEKNCPTVFPGVHTRLHWSFEDPAAFAGDEKEKLQKFRTVRDQIEQRIEKWLAEMGQSNSTESRVDIKGPGNIPGLFF